jgi:hypothetical protein
VNIAFPKVSHGNVIGRAAVLVPLLLALWWFVLKGASLWSLRVLAWLPLALLVAPPGLDPIRVDPKTGDWICNVKVNTIARNPQTGQSQRVNSIEIAIRSSDAALYASGWFSYLGLALSAGPFSRKHGKRVLWGFGIQTVVNTLSLATYVYIIGYGSLISGPGISDSRVWWVKYFDHINSLVVPFASPFLVAILMYPEWRESAGLTWPVKTESRRRQASKSLRRAL